MTPGLTTPPLEYAAHLAALAHAGQLDRQGVPALNHVLRVSAAGETEEEKIVGALHDIVEDTPITISVLRDKGFPSTITDAVQAITRRGDEGYFDYIDRVARNPLAARVKLHDLRDNLSRNGTGPSLRARYLKAMQRLAAASSPRTLTDGPLNDQQT